jgi:hypothetical protein
VLQLGHRKHKLFSGFRNRESQSTFGGFQVRGVGQHPLSRYGSAQKAQALCKCGQTQQATPLSLGKLGRPQLFQSPATCLQRARGRVSLPNPQSIAPMNQSWPGTVTRKESLESSFFPVSDSSGGSSAAEDSWVDTDDSDIEWVDGRQVLPHQIVTNCLGTCLPFFSKQRCATRTQWCTQATKWPAFRHCRAHVQEHGITLKGHTNNIRFFEFWLVWRRALFHGCSPRQVVRTSIKDTVCKVIAIVSFISARWSPSYVNRTRVCAFRWR